MHVRGEDGGVVGERRLCVRTSVRGDVVISTLCCHTCIRAGALGGGSLVDEGTRNADGGGG